MNKVSRLTKPDKEVTDNGYGPMVIDFRRKLRNLRSKKEKSCESIKSAKSKLLATGQEILSPFGRELRLEMRRE